MNAYEELQEEASNDNIDVINYPFASNNIKGLYCDGTIAIREDIDTTTEKSCILVEEMGHHHTSVGCILDQTDLQNRKQERQARLWGYNRLIGLTGIIRAYKAGCQSRHEIAEYLDITDEYLQECIDCYREKYGVYTIVDNYIIYFIPYLAVAEMI